MVLLRLIHAIATAKEDYSILFTKANIKDGFGEFSQMKKEGRTSHMCSYQPKSIHIKNTTGLKIK